MGSDEKTSAKMKRPPRLFRRRLQRRALRRRILKRIPIRTEREWVRDLYGDATPAEGGDNDVLERRDPLTKEEIKRLRQLAKAVKHNRGYFQPVKLGLLGGIVGAILVFALVFAAPLAARGVERGLESVFGARAELDGFELRFLEPGFAFEVLAVADRNRPMYNLFDIGGGELRVDLGQLVRGRVVIRNIEARDISFGGERNVSGELPPERRPAPLEEADERPGAAEQVSALFGDTAGEIRGMISGIDAREIVEAELDALSTPDAVALQQERIGNLVVEWQQRMDDAEEAVSEFTGDVEAILAIDPSSIDSISRLREAVQTAERVTDGGRDFYDRGLEGYHAAASTTDDVRGAVDEVRAAVEQDIAYIESRIPDPETVLREPFAGLVSSIAEEHVAPYVDRARTVYDAYLRVQRLRERFAGDDAVVDDRPERGRDIVFPSPEYPRFLLERASVNFVGEEFGYVGSLAEISSNPDLTGEPARARFSWAYGAEDGDSAVGGRDSTASLVSDGEHDGDRERNRGGDVQVNLDLRRGVESRVGVSVDLFGGNMSLPVGSPGVIPVDTLSSRFDLEARLAVSREGEVVFRGDSSLFEPVFSFSADNEITRRTQSVLDRTETVTAGITLPPGDEPAVRTNLDEALAAELEAFIRELRDRALEEAEVYVREQFSSEIAQVEQLVAQGTAVVEQAQDRYNQLVELYEQAEREKERIEARIADLEQQIEQRAREEVERAEQRAREEAERAEQRAREEAERAEQRAREEAERAEQEARDEVEGRVRDRLDGFMGR